MLTAGWLSTLILVVLVIIDIAIRIAALIIVPINRKPQTATAWLLAIFLIPYAGFLLFLLLGSNKLPRKRRRKQDQVNRILLEATEGLDEAEAHPGWPQWLQNSVSLNRALGAMPLVRGNTANLHANYEDSIRAMTDAVERAKRFVHAEFYILSLDRTTAPFFDALETAVQRGVTVRVLLDHVANLRQPGYRATKRRLTEAGIQWQLMLPIQPLKGRYQRLDLRNHRKLVVIDGELAFTGSQNMVDSSYNKRGNIKRGLHWKDLMVEFDGPIVAGINALFLSDWYAETDELLLREIADAAEGEHRQEIECQVVPSGPAFRGENNLRLFNDLIYAAEERIVITSPYFVPDDSMLYAVTTAAQSGVAVELFVSEVADQKLVYHAQRSYYEVLLRAGVRIWLYAAPTVLHAKHFTIDDDVAVIGSSNMDMRSFSLNLEISVMVHGRSFVSQLRDIEAEYRSNSRELTLDEWLTRPTRSVVFDNLARLTATVQ
ncbi:cardiolipin synthase [Salinibacterium sp. SYSU T00001]|uniref:cardiolipin synthase n=1 Tax=Homoserinimonas sedimenticola TaxID=2986805 RepID=UPI002235B7AF|nr:cardiolipin synthase [Salinibacterium sedimenticola]MCW4385977.1 cardiolipin synthase [Salinibacterium sedimenticola]